MTGRASGHYTVTPNFIDERHIDGSDELAFLDRQGEFDEFLVLSE